MCSTGLSERKNEKEADGDGTATESAGGDESIGGGDEQLNRWIERGSSAGGSGPTDCPSIRLSHAQTARDGHLIDQRRQIAVSIGGQLGKKKKVPLLQERDQLN